MGNPDFTPEQRGFPRSLKEVKRPSDEEVEEIPAIMQDQIAKARRARRGKISPSGPEMRKTVVGPTPDEDFLRTYVGLNINVDIQRIAEEASARLEQVGIAQGVTERPLRDFLAGVTRMDDPWPETIILFGEPANLPSERPALNFELPMREGLNDLSRGFVVEEVANLMYGLGHELLPEGIDVFNSFMNIIPNEESPQATLENLQSRQKPGNVLAFAITR